MSSKVYFESEVQEIYLQEYLDIRNTPKFGLSEKELKRINERQNIIIHHIFTEVFSAFADEHAPVEPELELV